MRTIAILLHISLLAGPISAAVLDVSPDGSGPYPSLQQAMAAAAPHDTIRLADGVFTGPENRNLLLDGAELTVLSAHGNPATCVLDVEGQGRGFLILTNPGSVITVQGVTIRNGDPGDLPESQLPGYGGAIAIKSLAAGGSVLFDNCILENNLADAGGGAFLWESEAVFNECIFRNNLATDGSGAYCGYSNTGSGPTFSVCLFHANDYPLPGVGGYGGGLYFSHSDGTVENCTFVDNRAWFGGGLLVSTDSSVHITNSLVAFNTSSEGVAVFNGVALITRTDIFGNDGGDWVDEIMDQLGSNGNISADPLFCGAGIDDYSLNSGSPCAAENNEYNVLIGALAVACGPPTGIADQAPIPANTILEQCHPNPFNPSTKIRFRLQESARVHCAVYGLDGRRVAVLVDEFLSAGSFEATWNGHDDQGRMMPSGAYLCRLDTGVDTVSRRMMLVR
jgi:hypothetical protein